MKKLGKLLLINCILAIILQVIPEGKIEITYTYKEQVQTIVLASITKEETERAVAEMLAKNYSLTLDTDLRTKSNLTADDYNSLLRNTYLDGIGEALEKAEQQYNVNGLYLMGLCIVESGWGTSSFAINRNNLVGWNAIDSNPNQATTFKSKEECILHVASKLQSNYLTENGVYFEGYTPKDIDVHYCTDKLHANKIVNTINCLIKERIW